VIPFVTMLVRFVRAVAGSWKDPEFRGLFFLVVVTLATGTLFYWHVERWTPLDSLYLSVVTLTTVGYGDLVPTTAAGKVFTILYILVGIGIILGFVNAVAERSIERRKERTRSRRCAPSLL
jgi:voltage-gated potassium channel